MIHESILQPNVVLCQQLNVARNRNKIKYMFNDEVSLFAIRLHQVADLLGIPASGNNRQALFGKMFKVSQEAARKWLSGEGLPKQATCIHIAKKANISYEWLMTGRGEMSIDTHYDIPDKLKLHLQALQKLPDYAVDEVIRDALKTAELIEKATNEAHKPNGTK